MEFSGLAQGDEAKACQVLAQMGLTPPVSHSPTHLTSPLLAAWCYADLQQSFPEKVAEDLRWSSRWEDMAWGWGGSDVSASSSLGSYGHFRPSVSCSLVSAKAVSLTAAGLTQRLMDGHLVHMCHLPEGISCSAADFHGNYPPRSFICRCQRSGV
ncbi:hypothetical protein Q8A73_004271 [Channa argus]|nr:hypothetical protein Q8A73_004271 [Channa argus]